MTCSECKQAINTGADVDAVATVLDGLKRTKAVRMLNRRALCEALRWCADWLDVQQDVVELR